MQCADLQLEPKLASQHRICRSRARALLVAAHFLPAQLLAGLRRRSRTLARGLPLATCLTDLDLQSMWVQQVDAYFLPRAEAATVLRSYAPTPAALTVSGLSLWGSNPTSRCAPSLLLPAGEPLVLCEAQASRAGLSWLRQMATDAPSKS